ncbi:hypothetical protein NUW54_g6556 [Trametes sanguinea]|uniref:Uncharacterized protein n=1 Tax=Trametes sanguinea TaxID=158606 RepID=A0ACC1PTC5_9APHY|nr:hypothetical protein NUW54_g6556 [Trametes sanguinea]
MHRLRNADGTIAYRMRSCDGRGCRNLIGGACLICLDCLASPELFYSHLTFCDDPACYLSQSTYSRHDSSHDFLKIRTVLHAPDIPAVLRDVENAFRFIRLFSSAVPSDPPVSKTVNAQLGAQSSNNEVGTGGTPLLGPGEVQPYLETDDVGFTNGCEELVDTPEPHPTANPPDLVRQGSGAAQFTEGIVPPDVVNEASSSPGSDGSVFSRHNSHVDSAVGRGDGEVQQEDRVGCRCKVCKKPVYMGLCWFCLRCWEYICDDCDTRMLIAGHECGKPFTQADWYCGQRPSDFICPLCFARGITVASSSEAIPRRSHVGTHSLIRCKHERAKPANAESEAAVLTTEERLANLEWQMTAADEKLEKMQDHLMRLEERQDEMQQAILSTLQDMLSRVTGRMDGNADHNSAS